MPDLRITPELRWLWTTIRPHFGRGFAYPVVTWILVRTLSSMVPANSAQGLVLTILSLLAVIWVLFGPPILAVKVLRGTSALGSDHTRAFSAAFMILGAVGWSLATFFAGNPVEALSTPLVFIGLIGLGGLVYAAFAKFYEIPKACYQAASDGEFKQAGRLFQLLIQTCEGNTEEARTVVHSLIKENRHLLALDFVETLLNSFSQDLDVRLLQARVYTDLDKPQQAALALTEAIKLAPNSAQIYFDRYLAHVQIKGEFQAALHDLNQSIDLEPDNADFLAHRASMLNRSQKHKEALADAEAAHALDPGSQKAILQLSLSWMRLGQPEKADVWFQRLDTARA